MKYPTILLTPGNDIKIITDELNNVNVSYSWYKPISDTTKTELRFKQYNWFKNGFDIIKIRQGLTLPFFNTKPVKLTWDVAACIPNDQSLYNWDIDVTEDIKIWDSKLELTRDEKCAMAMIVSQRIVKESETLKLYNDALLTTFLHPSIQALIRNCSYRKDAHINMWTQIKDKFRFQDYPCLSHNPTRIAATTLDDVVNDLTELISIEELVKPAATTCVKQLITKGYLIQFIKLVQRRDRESLQNSRLLKILLFQLEKMYPFLNEKIKAASKHATTVANHNNRRIFHLEMMIY